MFHLWKNQLVCYTSKICEKHLWKSDILNTDAGHWQIKSQYISERITVGYWRFKIGSNFSFDRPFWELPKRCKIFMRLLCKMLDIFFCSLRRGTELLQMKPEECMEIKPILWPVNVMMLWSTLSATHCTNPWSSCRSSMVSLACLITDSL